MADLKTFGINKGEGKVHEEIVYSLALIYNIIDRATIALVRMGGLTCALARLFGGFIEFDLAHFHFHVGRLIGLRNGGFLGDQTSFVEVEERLVESDHAKLDILFHDLADL